MEIKAVLDALRDGIRVGTKAEPMLMRLLRAFRPLDTSEFDAAHAEAMQAERAVRVHAHALRMDISRGDAEGAIRASAGRVRAGAGEVLRSIY